MKRSQIRCWKSYCSEPLDKIEHYEEALADNFVGWCMHDRREIQQGGTRVSRQELKDKDLYFHRPASELVFMRREDHISLHHKGKVISAETRRKLSEALSGENNPLFGKHLSEDTRQKMSVNNGRFWKGKHLSEEHRQKMSVNNGRFWKGKHLSEETRQKMSASHKGKNLGVHWWNNGILSIRSRECPGEGWTRGRLKFK